jgi:hypothetical protein
MGASEVDAVRSFCRFVQLKAAAAPQAEGTWRSAVDHDIAALVAGAVSAASEVLRSMIEAGRVIEKMKRGMEAAAVATPRGPVMVAVDHGVGLGRWGCGITVTAPGVTTVRIHGFSWPDAAVALHDALVATGGPMELVRPADMTEAEREAVAGFLVEKLRDGRETLSLPEHDIEVVLEPNRWVLTKGEKPPAYVARDAWDLLRSELAWLMGAE